MCVKIAICRRETMAISWTWCGPRYCIGKLCPGHPGNIVDIQIVEVPCDQDIGDGESRIVTIPAESRLIVDIQEQKIALWLHLYSQTLQIQISCHPLLTKLHDHSAQLEAVLRRICLGQAKCEVWCPQPNEQ